MKKFNPLNEVCPHCHSKGNCIIHGKYKRHLIDYQENNPTDDLIDITRVRCKSCGRTHAILPDVIIPYRSFGLLFILRILTAHLIDHRTILDICDSFFLSDKLVGRWLSLFRKHRLLWLPALEAHLESEVAFLKGLLNNNSLSDFTSGFLLKTGRSFLQNHANPDALSRQVAF